MSTLAEILDPMTVGGTLYERLPDNAVRCFACGHRCLIREGRRGICQARFNRGGELRVPWGYVAALQSDPIEKKPFFHGHGIQNLCQGAHRDLISSTPRHSWAKDPANAFGP